MKDYPNWFSSYADRFFAHHLTRYARRPDVTFLQIGAFTGDASVWMLDNVLTGAGSSLVDVDTWRGSDEPDHEAINFADVERVYDTRTRDYVPSGRLRTYKETSADFFRGTLAEEFGLRFGFDFIYIDGDHTAVGVLTDAVNAYQVLKVGGLIAFDDYLWQSGHGRLHDPGPAIDAVADLYADRLAELDGPIMPGQSPLQRWFRKIA